MQLISPLKEQVKVRLIHPPDPFSKHFAEMMTGSANWCQLFCLTDKTSARESHR